MAAINLELAENRDDLIYEKEYNYRARSLSGKLDRELADAVLEVSVKANREIVEELKGDEAMCQALLEIMEPEIKEIVRQATEKERREKEEANREREKANREREEAVRQVKQEKEESEKESQKEAEESAIKMIKMKKLTMEEIQECVPKLSMEDIKRLAKGLAQV